MKNTTTSSTLRMFTGRTLAVATMALLSLGFTAGPSTADDRIPGCYMALEVEPTDSGGMGYHAFMCSPVPDSGMVSLGGAVSALGIGSKVEPINITAPPVEAYYECTSTGNCCVVSGYISVGGSTSALGVVSGYISVGGSTSALGVGKDVSVGNEEPYTQFKYCSGS